MAAPLLAAGGGYAFEYWDVFTDRRFTGNPLAVFTSATGLNPEQMTAIARETNLSETTFVFRRPAAEEARKGIRTRIFTPSAEYDFAGHTALGTAISLWRPGMKQVTLEMNVGAVPVEIHSEGGRLYGEMLQPEPKFGEEHDPSAIARLTGLALSAIDTTYPIQNVSTGRPNLIVMVKDLAAIRSIQVDWPAVAAYFAGGEKQRSFYFLTPQTESAEARFHARKLTPRTEDPVTGSAAGSAIAWLVARKIVGSGERIVIEQGAEVSRPGKLYVSAERSGAGATRVRAGGYAVKVWTGELPAGSV
ncbi:MAG: PhzF family phenazine biosynthesis protein [Acidobacteria bacterium]|nr:PhzF family phenazine biosynthesis protein [Acidobacteriota bacterium]